jgi:hypothetical protein
MLLKWRAAIAIRNRFWLLLKETSMKRIATIVSLAVTALLVGALPILAESVRAGNQAGSGQRNECLLMAKLDRADCPNTIDTIGNRIVRLNKEISKGTEVYSQDELKHLNKELEQYRAMYDYIDRNAPQGAY